MRKQETLSRREAQLQSTRWDDQWVREREHNNMPSSSTHHLQTHTHTPSPSLPHTLMSNLDSSVSLRFVLHPRTVINILVNLTAPLKVPLLTCVCCIVSMCVLDNSLQGPVKVSRGLAGWSYQLGDRYILLRLSGGHSHHFDLGQLWLRR